MMSRQQCLETPAKLNVAAWRDPLIEAAGHRPGTPYVEAVWLAIIGPASTWGWQRLARIAAASKTTVTIDAAELAAGLGLGTSLGRNAPISRTLARLEAFGTVQRSATASGCASPCPMFPSNGWPSSARRPSSPISASPTDTGRRT